MRILSLCSTLARGRAAFVLLVLSGLLSSACSHTANIQTDPPGATITVDEEVVGTTPMDVPIKAGAIDGEQAITVSKGDATRTLVFDNDQFIWEPLLWTSGLSVAAAALLIGAGGITFGVNSAVGLTAVATGVLMLGFPVLSFLLSSWRMPNTVNISLRDDSVQMSEEGDYKVVVSSGRIGDAAAAPAASVHPAVVPPTSPVAPNPIPVAGSVGGACYGNGTCNAGLSCSDGICREAEAGTAGGACYGNGTCNAGLSCADAVCVAE